MIKSTYFKKDYSDILFHNFQSVYYIFFSIYCVFTYLSCTSFADLPWMHIGQLYVLVRITCIVILGAYVLSQRYTELKLLVLLTIGCAMLVSTLSSGYWGLLLSVLFIVAGKDVSIRKLAKCTFWSSIGVSFAAFLASSIGLITSLELHGEGGYIRHAYGFTHPNTLGMCILVASCAYAVMNFRKFRWLDLLFYGCAFYVCFDLAHSRTSSYEIAAICVMSLIVYFAPRRMLDKPILAIGTVIFVMLSFFSIWIMVNYDPSVTWMYDFNRFLSNRFDLMHHYYMTYQLHPFGYNFSAIQEIYSIPSNGWVEVFKNFVVDNVYAHTFLESGYIVWLLIIVLYTVYLVRQTRKGILSNGSFGLILFAVAGFTEFVTFSVFYNFCLVSLASFVFKCAPLENESIC